jgi:membrane carboxypeptidase/penicillin-binding protein
MIAGIIQTPARQSPYVNRGAAKFRRDYTLQQMADNGYITQEQADASKQKADCHARSAAAGSIGGAVLHRGSP